MRPLVTAFLCVVAVLGILLPGCTHAATSGALTVPPGLQRALPAHARVDAYVAIHGYRNAYAAQYHTTAAYLAVVQSSRRVWQRGIPATSLPAQPSLLTSTSTGLFALILRSQAGAKVYAYRLSHGHVTSGIAGGTSSVLSATEGAAATKSGFKLLNHDASHVGSVAYRRITTYHVCSGQYCESGTTYRPDYAPSAYPKPNGVIKNQQGDITLIRLEIASTEPERQVGLMNRKSLDPDSGMIFVWDSPVQDSFWMENTYIPLTVAFLAPDGTILETQDMAALTTNLHTPHETYQYAIEANLGFFAQHGIKVGDRVALNLTK